MGTRKFVCTASSWAPEPAELGTAQANPAIPHDANETSTSKAIQQRAIELGVSPAVALQLAANLEQGKLPDSDLGVEPEATFETRSSGQVERREIYPDGSVSVSSVPDLEAVAQSATITRAYEQQNTSFFGTTSHISFGRLGSQSAAHKVQWSAIKDVSSRTNTLAATISNDGVMSSKFY